ncbi:MAG: glycosyltransferase family 2 protein [Pirellulales bacterium]
MTVSSSIGDIIMAIPGFGASLQIIRSLLGRQRPSRGPRPSRSYARWVRENDSPSWSDIRLCRAQIAAFAYRPTISVLMPVFDPNPAFLEAAIQSVRQQAYPCWELCVTDNASTNPAVATVLRLHGAVDSRIKVHVRPTRGDVSAASNTALATAAGDFIVGLAPDDLLPPLALYWLVESINRHPEARVLYSDEDTLNGRGERRDPHFKGGFNHALLLGRNMMSRLGALGRDLVVSVGGFRPGFEGAQDHDLVLRCVAAVSRDEIVHIPRVLYHSRAPASGSETAAAAQAAVTAAQRAVAEHVQRFDSGALVEQAPEAPMFLRIRHSLPTPAPQTSIIICTRDHASLLRIAIESIVSKTTYPDYEIVVLDNGSRDPAALDYLAAIAARPGITVIRDDSPFNYSRLNNTAVARARGRMLCLLNDDIEVLTPDWLNEMVSFAAQPDVGAVGARLWYPDGTLQHGGVIIGIGGVAGHAHPRLPKGDTGYFCRAVLQQELSAVTAACLVMRREVFEQVGGLDERIAVAFNDVDLCLRIRSAGYRIIWTPFAELIHHESASRGYEDTPEKLARFHREVRFMQERWGATLDHDPYYSPNLSKRSGDYVIEPGGHRKATRRAA